ncbi:DUF4124 domain-containing protein [Panacagrimonas sp.]|uniref:DUF4124 domain-containing protein n=1 Tax=Panacagrimonas sp. TaxID=2480088 RepID=UPI003B5276E3
MNRLVFAARIGAILLIASAPSHSRTVYQWTDAQGVEHYSDTPVAGARKVWIEDSLVENAPRLPASAQPESSAAGANIAQEDSNAAQCILKRKQLEQYQRSVSISERDHLGNEREYSASERAQLMELTRSEMEQACAS